MSYLLADPTAVLVAGGTGPARDRVESVLGDDTATDVLAAADVGEVRSTLSTRDDVGCVVALDVDESAFVDLYEDVRAVDADLPLVASTGRESVAPAVAERSDCRYLPESTPLGRLAAVIADALSTYARRRQTAADSGVLGTLLAEGDLSLFAKDDRGRYLRMADVPYTVGTGSIEGKTDREVFPYDQEAATEAYEDDLRVAETGEPIRGKLENFEGQGGDHWSEVTKLPWRDGDGEIQGVVGYSLDATERVRVKRQLERQRRRLDQFASYVSHDLRTPLQISVGSLERAREGHEEAFDRIERANERIEEIIDDLSSLAKGDRSDLDLSEEVLEVLDVGVPTTELAALVERVWAVHGTEDAAVEIDVPGGTEVVAETETVRPVLENLLKNALDHAGPNVTVRVGALERGFYVEDDGPGIPAAERDRILEDGYTTAEDGTGTGLAIVAETAHQQGWSVRVTDSEPGPDASPGARFEITGLPMVVPTATTPSAPVDLDESVDVGEVSMSGESTWDPVDETWRVVADGRDIWRDIDEFHFVHGAASDPVRIEGRLSGLDGPHEYSKAGLMVRDGLAEDAPFGFVGATAEHGTETLWREDRGADASSDQLEEPYEAYPWYRVEAVDGTVTLSWSTDGEEWQALDQRTVELESPLAVGLAVCGHSDDERCEATFESVSASELDDA
ncbi:MAG: ATP-binding protein [Halosimplex sp.]